MRTVEIVVYGDPVPQGRPRFSTVGGYPRAVDPQKSRNYKQLVRFWVTQRLKKIEGWKPFENAVIAELNFYLPIPISWTKKKRIEAANGVIRPISKFDADNLYKSVTDACTGLLWKDDGQITDVTIRKRYTAELARVEIKVTEVE